MANLGELLAELRHDRGLKQEELADILHLSKSTISSYERGQQLPPLDMRNFYRIRQLPV